MSLTTLRHRQGDVSRYQCVETLLNSQDLYFNKSDRKSLSIGNFTHYMSEPLVKFLYFAPESGSTDAKFLGRFGAIAIDFLKYLENVLLLDVA